MPYFYVNKNAQSNGDHEVHETGASCNRHADPQNRVDLGYHSNCQSAVTKAKSMGYKANGCYYCAKACHTS